MTTEVMERKTKTVVKPFGIAASHPRNQDLMMQCIPGCRLRTEIIASRTVKDKRTGDEVIPQDQAIHLGQLPKIPGMQLHVNPEKLTYRIVDPLHDDEETCERIRRHMNKRGAIRVDNKLNGVPPHGGELDKHRMKSLCREMVQLLDAGHAKIAKGMKPSTEEVDGLPGRYLLNPGSRVPHTQPVYEDQYESWVDRLDRSGG